MKVVVRRSALRMWLMAMGGIPLLVVSLDVLTERRITRWLTDLIFAPEDIQIYEPRDVIYAWVMLLFAVLFVGWGLKELFLPTKVVECHESGLAMKLRGPFQMPDLVPWGNIRDVVAAEVNDEGDLIPLLVVSVFTRDGLPENPWSARWVSERELGLMAQDWGVDPSIAADQIADYAVEITKKKRREATAKLWQES